MTRRVVGTLAVVVMLVLAGCSYDSTVGISAQIRDVSPLEDDSYEVTLSANSDGGDVVQFSAVRIYGYSLSGDLVCTADFGEISGETEMQRIICSQFPAILAPGTAESGTVEHDGYSYDIIHSVTLYKGQVNGTHRFDHILSIPDDRYFSRRNGRPTPNESLLLAGKCIQWRSDADYSILERPTWITWKQNPPNTSRTYSLTVWNYTRLENLNQTSLVDLKSSYVYQFDQLSPEAQHLITAGSPIERARTGDINASAYNRTISALSGKTVHSYSDLPAVLKNIHGNTGHWNNTGIDCWANPPQYREGVGGIDYDTGYYAHVFVEHDGTTYALSARTRTKFTGPAIANVTASRNRVRGL